MYRQICAFCPKTPEQSKEMLQLFSFVSMLSYDVYVKRLLIEKMIDSFKTASGHTAKPGRE